MQPILIVEDDLDIREAMVDLLSHEGHETVIASNGLEALHYIKNHPRPCLVLLDMMMPIMNGRQFLDAFQKVPEHSSIPIVILSAIADRVDTSGAAEALKKPLDLNRILEVVAKYC